MKINKFSLLPLIFIILFININTLSANTEDKKIEKESVKPLSVKLARENQYILVVDKKSQTLFVYEYNGLTKKILQVPCSTGKRKGPKMKAGDSKTPEGIYFFIKEFKDKELAPIYGKGAFATDYPNLLDRLQNRTGSAIWLHGTNRPLKKRDSNGCVALENSNFEKVANYISLNKTPIIIFDEFSGFPPVADPNSDKLIARFIDNWNKSVKQGTYHDYVKFYSPSYVPDISWWKDWNNMRKHPELSESSVSVTSAGLLVFRHNDTYVALFDQYVSSSDRKIKVGTKKFFIKNHDGNPEIIGESYPGLDDYAKNPFILASKSLMDQIKEPEPEIEKTVKAWLAAWSSKDIEKYGLYYANDFKSQGMDKRAWLAYKKLLNKKYDYIKVTGNNFKTDKGKNISIVTFVQKYESSRFRATGIKKLILKLENGEWKIFRETWRKM